MASDPSPPSAAPPHRASCLTSVLTLIALLIASAVILVLPTGWIGPVFVFGGLACFVLFGFHYLVWGRWMNEVLKESEDMSDRKDV
jgi:hypothetical protein